MTSFKELARERLRNHTIQVQLKLGDLHLNTTKTQAKDVCICCDNPAGSVGIHKAFTSEVDFKVRTFATELCDTKLLAKLACGDMVAIDAQYHAKCLAKLYKRAQLSRKDQKFFPENVLHGIVFV